MKLITPTDGLFTPPSSPSRVHPALCAPSTVVRYDFAADPLTIRMSSSSSHPYFPSHDPASTPSLSVLSIRCEIAGHTITIHNRSGITCMDLLVQLHRYFDQPISSDTWRRVRDSRRDAMKAAYKRRTGREYNSQSARMKVVDYLLGQSRFKCVIPEHSNATESTWLLQTY